MKSNNLNSLFRTGFFLIHLAFIFSCGTDEPTPTPTYTLSTLVSPSEGGKINISPSAGPYNEGQTVTLTPEANPNWVFQKWEGDASGSSSPLTITMNSNKSVTAVFIKRDYPLNITIEGEGTVNEIIITNPSGREYPHGTTVELTPVPKDGWVFESWGGDLSGTEVPKRITVDGVKNVTAKFKLREYPLNITIEGEGTFTEVIVTNPSGKEYPHGTTVELTPVPAEGWVFESWGGDLSGNEVPKQILVDGEKNVTVTFKQGSTSVFYLAANGITCKCEGANPGDKGIINGVEYEAVDNDLVRNRRNEKADMTKLCTSLVTDMTYFFYNEKNLNPAIGNWDVGNVTDMEQMFMGSQFNQDISKWDVSSVINMKQMFAASKFNLSINEWNVSKVTNMASMFGGSQFNQPIGEWDVSNVTNMSVMFSGSQFNQAIGDWDVSKVTEMVLMFSESLFNQPIGDWNVGNVTNMYGMFSNSKFNHPIGNWNVSNVTSMEAMFQRSQFNQDIDNWEVGEVESMAGMFLESDFDQPIENWNVGKVEYMNQMFTNSGFNHPLGNWDVSQVVNMRGMFAFNTKFNQDLSKWCVQKIPTLPNDFRTGATAWLLPEPVWGTCPD
ncbi:BspA family leucine-rich repeat surface protein [Aquiflexum sp.]|uniref:BspA family leucine-rich repeat surface protein n=1 Tax=Aquiflexum sp. TaxID=1872584 RepID=UPI003593F2F9